MFYQLYICATIQICHNAYLALSFKVEVMKDIIIALINYLKNAGMATIEQLVIVFLPLIVFAFIQDYVSRQNEKLSCKLIGANLYLTLFGWLGTLVHELGHAAFALLFRHRITDIQFFKPDPESGTLGYVSHSYNPRNIYHQVGNFFIGIGPIVFGALFLVLLSFLLFDINLLAETDIDLSFNTLESKSIIIFEANNFATFLALFVYDVFYGEHTNWWKVTLFIYCLLSIGSSISLSKSDVKSSIKGFLIIVLCVLIFNVATYWAGNFSIEISKTLSYYLSVAYTIMLLSIVVNLFFMAILKLIAVITKK
jgi:hypothetical protein